MSSLRTLSAVPEGVSGRKQRRRRCLQLKELKRLALTKEELWVPTVMKKKRELSEHVLPTLTRAAQQKAGTKVQLQM